MPRIVYRVAPDRANWTVDRDRVLQSNHANKAPAIDAGNAAARLEWEVFRRPAQCVVHRADGTMELRVDLWKRPLSTAGLRGRGGRATILDDLEPNHLSCSVDPFAGGGFPGRMFTRRLDLVHTIPVCGGEHCNHGEISALDNSPVRDFTTDHPPGFLKDPTSLNDTTTVHGPHHVDRHVGALIRAKRRAIGMSQSELADALGITFQQVQKYERGANRVSSSKLYEIAQKLDMPLTAFFEGLDQPDGGASFSGELIDFLGESGSQDLVLAFRAMNPLLRRRLVALAKAMADTED